MKRSLLLVFVLGAVVVALAGYAVQRAMTAQPAAKPETSTSGSPPAAEVFPTETSDAGQVTVAVTPLNLGRPEVPLQFQVALNTHSVALDYDLAQLAVLRTDGGNEVTAVRWDGGRGGHHVSGTLSFLPIDLQGARWVEVLIRGVANVPERTFRWDLQ
jgi:hypothetical protein